MKKIFVLLVIAVLMCGTAFAISTEALLNKIFDSTNNTMRIQEGLAAGTVLASITTDSHSSGSQPLTPDSIVTSMISITSLPTNKLDISIGSSTTALYRLTGDRVLTIPIKDVSSVYFRSDNNSDGVSWICTQ